MSYIHDALRKAQQEKSRVVASCTSFWAQQQAGRTGGKPFWLAPAFLACIAVGFSAYSWVSSVDTLKSHGQNTKDRVYKAILTPATGRAPSPPKEPVETQRRNPRQHRTEARSAQGPSKPVRPPEGQSADRPADTDAPRPLTAKEPPRKSAETKPPTDNADTYSYAQALDLQKAGDLTKAKRAYEAVLRESPRMVSAMNNLGTIYMEEGNPARARVFFEKAIRIDPTFVDPFYNLACLHGTQKDVKRSLFYLKKAVSLNEAARQWAKADKDLENLRGHREYEEIINNA